MPPSSYHSTAPFTPHDDPPREKWTTWMWDIAAMVGFTTFALVCTVVLSLVYHAYWGKPFVFTPAQLECQQVIDIVPACQEALMKNAPPWLPYATGKKE